MTSTTVNTDIFLADDSVIESRPFDRLSDRPWNTVNIDNGTATIFIRSREQAEHLFDAAVEAVMQWREWKPDGFPVAASIVGADDE